ncbi:hypothetical protein AHAS_Ahas20G0047700 [Arachis hypogaea]
MCPDSKEAWRLAGLPSLTREVETWKWWLEFQNSIAGGSNTVEKQELAVNLTWQNWKARNELIFEQRRKTPWICLEEARRTASERPRKC